MSKTINIGLIGFGMAGKTFHSPIIAGVPGLKLKKIRETRKENIAAAQVLYPEAVVVDDVKAIFSDDSIDLVVVASSNTSHAPLAKEALLAGKHVLVEKPFTVTTAEADALLDLAKQQNKVLTVYQSRRWDSDFKTVKKVVDSGLLGNLVTYEAHYDRFRNEIRPNTWKEEALPGSGLLYDLGSHLIDQALLLFGLPREITAEIGTQRQHSKIVDNFDLRLHYEGLKVTLKAGMLVREAGPHFILHGDQGSFIKYGMDVQEAALKAGLSPNDVPDWGIEPQELWGNLNTTYRDLHVQGKIESETGNYRGLYENVYKAILGEAELEVKPEQARNTIRVIELAMQSSAEKRTVAYTS
ncbi:oxidoreductase [Pontibacter sp. 172403-2]|uniref:oxidoreductase n=1 Tax=Pontibacter rufus TaxID=2791028 RepID=UPI0018AF94B8|nr:oxidoreductase [Pontibacter sp. 172403-2]MBF9253752.1 oxidoreductase [Pontibacter sp. 172403-2]